MPQVRPLLFLLMCGALIFGCGSFAGDAAGSQSTTRIELHEVRSSDSDLEIRGLGKGGPRFVTRASLETLPQVEGLVKPDENFSEMPKEGVTVRGVDLEVLERALGLGASRMSAEGVCSDGYTAPFPAEYVKQHHPIVVLTVAGTTPKAWAEKTHTADMGPYFVAYDRYAPMFRVLSQDDRPQVPVQMVRLEFANYKKMFGGILPAWNRDPKVGQGFKIAQQNCFRCHYAAGYGGSKSGKGWGSLAKDARKRPEWFAKWVHDPQSLDPKAEMPANPKYDRATLTALTKYFSTMK